MLCLHNIINYQDKSDIGEKNRNSKVQNESGEGVHRVYQRKKLKKQVERTEKKEFTYWTLFMSI